MMEEYQDLAQELMKRHSRLKSVRRDYEPLWKDILTFVNLRRYDIDDNQRKGKRVGTSVYDGTATDALRDLADGLFGYLISPATQWFDLRVSDENLMAIREVKLWLEEVSWNLYSALQRSNFYEVMPEFFQDGGSIGTSTLYSEEDIETGRIVCTACHPGRIWVAENKYGVADTVIRQLTLTSRQAVQRFGEDANLTWSLKEDSKHSDRSDNEYTFFHIVQPFQDVMEAIGQTRRPTVLEKPYMSFYIQEDGKRLVSSSGYNTLPYQVWRWRKNSEEPYGSSPASDALVDILTSNQMSRTMLHAAHMAVEPPLNIPAELRGKVRINPRGENYYDETGRTISAIQMQQGGYPIGSDREAKVRESIRKHFMTDFFTLLSRAALEGRQLNVPQVLEMQGEKAVMLGTIIGRLNSECFDPFLDRVFQIEREAGRMPPPPDILLASPQRVQIEYVGPLAQAQRRLFKTQGIRQGLGAIAPFLEMDPQVMDNIDLDLATRVILEAYGFPMNAIRESGFVEQTRKARMEMQQAQEQAQLALQAAQQVPNLSKSPEAGSIVEALTGGGGK